MQKNRLSRFIFPALMALTLMLGAPLMAEAAGGDALDKEAAMAVESTDGGITSLVKKQLANYPNVMVSTNKGVVTLTGAVHDKVERDKVIDMVGRRGDIKGVVDELTVRNP